MGVESVDVPIPVDYDERLHVARFQWLAGERFSLRDREEERLADIARALATFHRCRLPDLPDHGADDELETLQRWTSMIEEIETMHHEHLTPVIDALAAEARGGNSAEPVTVHRDFYPKQLLFGDDTTWILDLDTMARGSACLDLGNVFAHLLLAALKQGRDHAFWEQGCSHVVSAYERANGRVDPECLAFYLRTSLVRVGAVHIFRTEGSRYAKALWNTASDSAFPALIRRMIRGE